MQSNECTGSHRFYVADIATVEQEGKVSVIIVCTSCGETRRSDHYVAPSNSKKEK